MVKREEKTLAPHGVVRLGDPDDLPIGDEAYARDGVSGVGLHPDVGFALEKCGLAERTALDFKIDADTVVLRNEGRSTPKTVHDVFIRVGARLDVGPMSVSGGLVLTGACNEHPTPCSEQPVPAGPDFDLRGPRTISGCGQEE